MAIFNYAAREMTAKIVYYGPGLSGKTTSIQVIHNRISPKNKGKLVSLATETDRTLFFDFFPVEFGQIGGFKIKFNFYTVPGQVFYNTTRKLVLKGADGVVFVADSQPGMMEQNLESLSNLLENLKAHGLDPETVPFVIQYNKRDMPGAMAVEEMRRILNPKGVPDFETTATTGQGIMEAMKAICRIVLEEIQKKQKGSAPKSIGEGEEQGGRVEPKPQGSPQPAAQSPPQPTKPAGIERTVALPLRGPGSFAYQLTLPVDFQLESGVEGAQVTVEVRVSYRGGKGQALVRELSGDPKIAATDAAADTAPKKKGFLARLFGGG